MEMGVCVPPSISTSRTQIHRLQNLTSPNNSCPSKERLNISRYRSILSSPSQRAIKRHDGRKGWFTAVEFAVKLVKEISPQPLPDCIQKLEVEVTVKCRACQLLYHSTVRYPRNERLLVVLMHSHATQRILTNCTYTSPVIWKLLSLLSVPRDVCGGELVCSNAILCFTRASKS